MKPPSRAQHVVLRLPDGDTELPAQVDDASEESVTLLLSALPSEVVAQLRNSPAVVEYTTPLGVYRLSGEIAGAGEDPEIVRLRRDGHDDVVQRRDFVRVDAVVPLQVSLPGGAARTTTLNVSGGGLLVQDPVGLEPGTRVDLNLDLAHGSPPVRATARVIREVAPGTTALEIVGIANEDRERLVRYVTERERMALRIARGR